MGPQAQYSARQHFEPTEGGDAAHLVEVVVEAKMVFQRHRTPQRASHVDVLPEYPEEEKVGNISCVIKQTHAHTRRMSRWILYPVPVCMRLTGSVDSQGYTYGGIGHATHATWTPVQTLYI